MDNFSLLRPTSPRKNSVCQIVLVKGVLADKKKQIQLLVLMELCNNKTWHYPTFFLMYCQET